MSEKPTLILSPRHTDSAQALWREAVKLGWGVERFHGWKVPQDFRPEQPVIYGEPLFNEMVATHLGISLPEPPQDFLCQLPEHLSGRSVHYMNAGEARKIGGKVFIKPPNKKTFKAGIFETGAGIPPDVPDDEPVLVQDIVQFNHEYRIFFVACLPVAIGSYMIDGTYAKQPDEWMDPPHIRSGATEFARDLGKYLELSKPQLGDSVVIDIGHISGRGWFVIEANEPNGSGCYNCEPYDVLIALLYATNRQAVQHIVDEYRELRRSRRGLDKILEEA